MKGWPIRVRDGTRAFLQSDVRGEHEACIIIKPPKEASIDRGIRWRLVKSLYGLRSTPSSWFCTLKKALVKAGFVQAVFDRAVFVLRKGSEVCGIVHVYVDDMTYSGDEHFDRVLDNSIWKKFKWGKEAQMHICQLGMDISQSVNNVVIRQSSYINTLELVKLEPRPIRRTRDKNVGWRELCEREIKDLQVLVGCFMWICTCTRPDIAAAVSLLSSVQTPTTQHVSRANKLLKYLKGSANVGLTLQKIGGNTRLIVFSDAAFQNVSSGHTQGGTIVLIGNEKVSSKHSVAVIGWTSRKIKRVVRSTFSGELLQQSEGLDSVIWTQGMLKEMTGLELPIDMYTDCQSLVDSLSSLRLRPKEKRLTVELSLLREAQNNKQVRSISHISTKFMLADGLTKDELRLRKTLCDAISGTVVMCDVGSDKGYTAYVETCCEKTFTAYLSTLLSLVDPTQTDEQLTPPPPPFPPAQAFNSAQDKQENREIGGV